MLEFIAAAHQVRNNPNQVTANSTANAAIIHFKDFFIGINYQFMIDAHFSKFIDNHSNFFAMFVSEDAIKQSGFACTKIAS